ncbi:uncharacterized protein LOC110692023 [Chenopodium quinoa]|uniref:uncharacterized protein LOC110692023 n=1 Tax=Chenopodium quinoa TaxID=63459 RepID=UPI000B77ED57|nr:uncharacterized protein LOC110692023 [Chenopodium quinoa]
MNKQKSITSFYKRKEPENDKIPEENNPVNEDTPTRTHNHEEEYPFLGPTKHRRRFQSTWFAKFPDWLEYAPSKDAAFCLPCYLFTETPNYRVKTFTLTGFKNWKKVNGGKRCGFFSHIGEGPCTAHRNAVQLGHNETNNYENQGNYLEFRKVLAAYYKDVSKAIRQVPYNAKYTAPSILKEILHIISNKVRNYIRQEIGNSKFCIIVDETRDESKREQMGLFLRFVDKYGTIRERLFDLIRVSDTTTATLKRELCSVLARHNLSVENIRGQGYDGASNMRDSGRGANQTSTLKRAGDTRWGSHLYSIHSLMKMFDATVLALEHISNDKSCNSSQRGDVDATLDLMISFDFVFIARLVEEILGIANVLCQALQQKSQDIVNAVKLVSTNHALIQDMRENGWESFLETMVLFCHQHDILIPDMNSPYITRHQ